MIYINKIKLFNFKRFKTFEVKFDDKLNLLIGDNEAGKSSILTAVDIVLSGSRNKVETIGLESLFNSDVIEDFLQSDRNYTKMPKLEIEIYLNEQNNEDINGKNNSDKIECDGLKLVCKPMDDYSKDIKDVLQKKHPVFPFEFYSIDFLTFADAPFSGYKKFIKHIFIDNSLVSSEYAMKEYVKDIYNTYLSSSTEKYNHHHEYRVQKEQFKNSAFLDINKKLGSDYSFALKTNTKSNVETDLTIMEGKISIDNKGKGKQCMIKTELILKKSDADLDVVLLEEPENHLSHINMKNLIQRIRGADDKQIFIATHSDLISTRLDLRKSILLNSNSLKPLLLNGLPEDTAKFFIKAPDNNILEFVLSKKVILVEGDAEFILMEAIYQKTTTKMLNESDVHIISVDGTSFKRYLDIAKLLKIRTAVVRDNDGNYQSNCVDNYSDYQQPNIAIFADQDMNRSTFEICFYQDNTELCDELFNEGRKTLTVQEYMLKNKADAAFAILDKKASDIEPPQYIKDAILWINGSY